MQKFGQSYKRAKFDERYDAIVIGSGMGGLSAAAILAKHAGWRVLVLEQHYTAGGYTHTFKRPGYEWDVGVHYVGGVQPPADDMRPFFDYVTDGRLQWADMGEVYDRLIVDGAVYDFVKGVGNFRRQLTDYFPGEARAIEKYIDLVNETAKGFRLFSAAKAVPPAVATVAGNLMRRGFMKYAGRTTRDVLEDLTDNRELVGVLTGQWGDYGLPPGRSSFGIHALIAHHYFEGASYPIGGASAIGAAAAPVIEGKGGTIAVRAAVARLAVASDRVTAVEMSDGRVFRAPIVISNAGVFNTFRNLLPQDAYTHYRLAERLEGLESSSAHVCLYVGLDCDDVEAQLSPANLWIYPGYDHDAQCADFKGDPANPLPGLYISFPSAKDPTFQQRYPGRATIDLITFMPYDTFAGWEGTRWKKRGAEYDALKAQLTHKMLDLLYTHVPGAKGRVAHQELSTPLTTRHFMNHQRGEAYGLAHTPARFSNPHLQPRTPIRNLFLTGQDVSCCGVAGALTGAVIATSAILGKNMFRVVGRRI